MDPEVQARLDGIRRRQRYLLVLLAYPYFAGLLWFAASDPTLTEVMMAVVPAVAILVVAYLLRLYRARSGGSGSGGSGSGGGSGGAAGSAGDD